MLLYSLSHPFVFPAAPGFSLEISYSHMEPASVPGADVIAESHAEAVSQKSPSLTSRT